MNPETLRADCPGYTACTYLNTGASGPSPHRVVDAVTEFERYHQFEAPCGDGPYEAAFEQFESTREAVARLLHADTSQIALTRSTVEGITHVAGALDWDDGDVVVTTDLEHPAGELPWHHLRRKHNIEIRAVPTEQGRLAMDTFKAAVEDATLVCLSSVTWNYGTRLPVSEIVDIAHDAGALVLVDAVQSPGQQPVDVTDWGADFVAASGHKWLLGPWGAGFLYVAHPGEFEPGRIGYFSVAKDDEHGVDAAAYRWHADARRFELGTRAVSAYAGLETAIETIERVGTERIERRISRLTDRLKSGLGERLISPEDSRSGLVAFEADNPTGLVERLAGEGIQIRWIPQPYACRASVHAVNTDADVDRLLTAL